MARSKSVAPKAPKRAPHNHCEWLNDRHTGYCAESVAAIFKHPRFARDGGLVFVCQAHVIDASGEGKRLTINAGGPCSSPSPIAWRLPVVVVEPDDELDTPDDPRTIESDEPAGWDEPEGCTSPRGWYFVDGLCRGNYLQYDHGKNYATDDPKTIHAVAYAEPNGNGNLGVEWFATIGEARDYIEQLYADYCARRDAVAA